MKKLLLLLTIVALFMTSCSTPKQPIFKYVDTIDIKNMSMHNVTIEADAVFENPNNLKGTISIHDMHIFIDHTDVGIVSSQKFDIPSKSEFKIPLEGTFSVAKIYKKNKKNLLDKILKIVQTDSLLVQYKGEIKYHLGSFSYPYKIDKTEKISLK